MINGDMVVAQTRQGATPPTWQVLHAKVSFFYMQIGLAIIMLLLGIGGLVALFGDPNTVYGYGLSDSSGPGVFNFWRAVDLIAVALLAFVALFYLVKYVFDLPRAKEQMLVLMPEGFVINSDKRVAYAYAAMRTLNVTISRGAVYVKLYPKDGAKVINVALDGRFGPPKKVAQMIATARNQFAAAQVAAQTPQPPVQFLNPQV